MERKWLYLIIAILAAVCLLLAGYIVGQRLGRTTTLSDRAMFHVFERMVAPLPENRRAEIVKEITPDQKRLRLALRSLAQIRLRVYQYTLSEDFDPEVLEEMLERMRIQLNEVKKLQDKRWVAIMSRLTLKERRRVLKHRFGRKDDREVIAQFGKKSSASCGEETPSPLAERKQENQKVEESSSIE